MNKANSPGKNLLKNAKKRERRRRKFLATQAAHLGLPEDIVVIIVTDYVCCTNIYLSGENISQTAELIFRLLPPGVNISRCLNRIINDWIMQYRLETISAGKGIDIKLFEEYLITRNIINDYYIDLKYTPNFVITYNHITHSIMLYYHKNFVKVIIGLDSCFYYINNDIFARIPPGVMKTDQGFESVWNKICDNAKKIIKLHELGIGISFISNLTDYIEFDKSNIKKLDDLFASVRQILAE